MEAILHKLCEKTHQELWDLLKENNWTKDLAEVAFYMVEILKGVKKIEHLKLVQEAMDRAEEMGEEGMEHMLGKEQNMHHYTRGGSSGNSGGRGGRTSGGRGSGGRSGGMSTYSMFDYDEGEGEGMNDYARRGRRMNYGYDNYNMPYPDWTEGKPHYPPMYYGDPHKDKEKEEKEKEKDKIVAEHFEKKYKEMLEDKWEKEKNEKQQGGRMLPPPPPAK